MFILVANDCFVVHIFDEFGYEKIILKGLSSKGQRQQLHCIKLKQDNDITKLGVFEKQKPRKIRMHENAVFVLTCHLSVSKTYGGGEHANVSIILDMKVIDEFKHGHNLVVSKQEILLYLLMERIWELL